jgi:catalase
MKNLKSAVAAMSGVALGAFIVIATPGWARADDDVDTQIVDALNKRYGVHPGYRADHAKGYRARR